MNSSRLATTSAVILSSAWIAGAGGCSNGSATSSVNPATLTYSAASAVSGPLDSHCAAVGDAGAVMAPTSAASCHPTDAAVAAYHASLGDASDDAPPYGDTMWNSSGSDDDCKYDLAWQATTVGENQDVYFKVTATHRTDGTPLTGSDPRIEVVNPSTNSDSQPRSEQATEASPGVYYVGPVQFNGPSVFKDAGGGATNDEFVRVHFFETCEDLLPDSPHAHAAFYISVP